MEVAKVAPPGALRGEQAPAALLRPLSTWLSPTPSTARPARASLPPATLAWAAIKPSPVRRGARAQTAQGEPEMPLKSLADAIAEPFAPVLREFAEAERKRLVRRRPRACASRRRSRRRADTTARALLASNGCPAAGGAQSKAAEAPEEIHIPALARVMPGARRLAASPMVRDVLIYDEKKARRSCPTGCRPKCRPPASLASPLPSIQGAAVIGTPAATATARARQVSTGAGRAHRRGAACGSRGWRGSSRPPSP